MHLQIESSVISTEEAEQYLKSIRLTHFQSLRTTIITVVLIAVATIAELSSSTTITLTHQLISHSHCKVSTTTTATITTFSTLDRTTSYTTTLLLHIKRKLVAAIIIIIILLLRTIYWCLPLLSQGVLHRITPVFKGCNRQKGGCNRDSKYNISNRSTRYHCIEIYWIRKINRIAIILVIALRVSPLRKALSLWVNSSNSSLRNTITHWISFINNSSE